MITSGTLEKEAIIKKLQAGQLWWYLLSIGWL